MFEWILLAMMYLIISYCSFNRAVDVIREHNDKNHPLAKFFIVGTTLFWPLVFSIGFTALVCEEINSFIKRKLDNNSKS